MSRARYRIFRDAFTGREVTADKVVSVFADSRDDDAGTIDRPGVIVTAVGENGYDFVSRYFAPGKGIPEDPVTGAAHCMLAPYWAERLNKIDFRAYQASLRGGEVVCRLRGDRVELEGKCVFYLEGEAEV